MICKECGEDLDQVKVEFDALVKRVRDAENEREEAYTMLARVLRHGWSHSTKALEARDTATKLLAKRGM